MENNEDAILQFWQWFVQNEAIIKDCVENVHSEDREYVVDQMNECILALGMLTWDLGINEDNKWFLLLSPNGNSDMLKVSQKIIDFAPDHNAWIFHASKPAKNWNRQFSIYDQYMDIVEIDASDWYYVILEDEDEKFELILEAKNISQLDSEEAETAAEQFVIHEIGEELRINHLSTVSIVESVESEFESWKASVSELKGHLEEII